jgi:hypothetical protein
VKVVSRDKKHPFRTFTAVDVDQIYDVKINIEKRYFEFMKAKIEHINSRVFHYFNV